MKLLQKSFLFFLILNTLYIILYPAKVLANDFKNDYQVEYFLSESENKLNSKVKFTVSITNFRSDIYVKQFSIGFPKLFTIKDIKAFDDYAAITPQVSSSDSITKVTLEFSRPNIGKNSVSNLYLEFYQDNLFSINGNVWEVIIPTIENKENSAYKILVHLPENSNKKISISKPKPDNIYGNTIIWNNPSTKTVYAVFGDRQYYKSELTYRIKNTKLVPVYTDIAFPPDTLWQKIYLDKINPPPAKVYSDEDGNYLGRYFLNPGESKIILYSGTIAVFSKLREDIIKPDRNLFFRQKKYLLSETKYWKISQKNLLTDISADAKGVYYFVTNKLNYDYNKINSDNKRLGADQVLKNPDQAVCMEFTDLFIALARAKGIYAREIEGYGFSQDPKLRPLSLFSDILHSWPEYYDLKSQLWIPVDPTWENTSGIDYFSSFDLNHITFVIHGKDPEYPLPAGTYKTENSRDVSISASNKLPKENQSLSIEHDRFPSRINDTQIYQAKINVINKGNTYIWDNSILIKTNNLDFSPSAYNIESLAPYEKKAFAFTFKSKVKNKQTEANFSITLPYANTVYAELIIIPFYYEIAIKISLGFLVVFTFIFLLFINKKRRAKIL